MQGLRSLLESLARVRDADFSATTYPHTLMVAMPLALMDQIAAMSWARVGQIVATPWALKMGTYWSELVACYSVILPTFFDQIRSCFDQSDGHMLVKFRSKVDVSYVRAELVV